MSTQQNLISIDIHANMGFLKKPDINEGLYLTFQYLHKPALLGILGAILGLEGYSHNKIPEYQNLLQHIPIAIEPLAHDKGNYNKMIVTYTNTVGYANKDGNLIITEQLLIKPSARCFLLIDRDNDLENRLFLYLEQQQAEYLPYWGKNDFPIWWSNFQIHNFSQFTTNKNFKVKSLFFANEIIKDHKVDFTSFITHRKPTFACFEMLPIRFDTLLRQYHYERFVFTNSELVTGVHIDNLYSLGNNNVIQLF